jgi:hypothetical protein
VVGGGALFCSRGSPDPVPIVQAQSPGTTSTTTGTVAPATAAPYRSLVATATVPELEVFALKPADPSAPPDPAATSTTTQPPGAVAAIPRISLISAGSRKTPTGWAFTNPTPFKSPLVVAVTKDEGDWLEVEVAARPNSQHGWVRASDVEVSESAFRMELTLSDFTLRVFQGDELFVETTVVIGRDTSPTPVGRFFLGEVLSAQQAGVGGPNGAYGPFILATSAYSETLDLFDGGLPVIAFHGTNQPDLIGTKASNGCVRMPNEVVTQLAENLPAGTVITVTA